MSITGRTASFSFRNAFCTVNATGPPYNGAAGSNPARGTDTFAVLCCPLLGLRSAYSLLQSSVTFFADGTP